ncbi:MAG: hypothetical protein H6696_10240 [Deferribacteres bacterium]|nr:hypothetical protein [candidate division KSB1 bacterium]MCB9502308.1 hypothetical protein [Deferribacteres bacterium]
MRINLKFMNDRLMAVSLAMFVFQASSSALHGQNYKTFPAANFEASQARWTPDNFGHIQLKGNGWLRVTSDEPFVQIDILARDTSIGTDSPKIITSKNESWEGIEFTVSHRASTWYKNVMGSLETTTLYIHFINDFHQPDNGIDRNVQIDSVRLYYNNPELTGDTLRGHSITITWEPNTEPDMSHYSIYLKNSVTGEERSKENIIVETADFNSLSQGNWSVCIKAIDQTGNASECRIENFELKWPASNETTHTQNFQTFPAANFQVSQLRWIPDEFGHIQIKGNGCLKVTSTEPFVKIDILAKDTSIGTQSPELITSTSEAWEGSKITVSTRESTWYNDGTLFSDVTALYIHFINDFHQPENNIDRNVQIDSVRLYFKHSKVTDEALLGHSVSVTWDPNTEPNISHYSAYLKNNSTGEEHFKENIMATTVDFDSLSQGNWSVCIKAVDKTGNTSGCENYSFDLKWPDMSERR